MTCVFNVICDRYPGPIHNVDDTIYETVEDPAPTESAKRTPKEKNITAEQTQNHDRNGSFVPPLPPRMYSLSLSLDNLNLQDLSNDREQNSQPNPQMDGENTYQPLIPPQCSNSNTIASEYQSLTQLKQSEANF